MKKSKRIKKRLDQALVDQGLIRSRERAKAMIMAGKVLVNGIRADKPGTQVDASAGLKINAPDHPYVGRGGLKLEKALQSFPVSVQDAVCLDIGASSGGFTDCLLKYGAQKVFAVDVGYGQLDWSLRQDNRVVVIERTNIRHLDYETIGQPMDAVVADTSFISLKTVIPSAEKFMRNGTDILALIKPQFEAGKENVGKGGIIKDPEIRNQVKQEITYFFQDRGYKVNGTVTSPVLGAKGNEEYIIWLVYQKK